LPDPDPESDPE